MGAGRGNAFLPLIFTCLTFFSHCLDPGFVVTIELTGGRASVNPEPIIVNVTAPPTLYLQRLTLLSNAHCLSTADGESSLKCRHCDFYALEKLHLQCHRRWHASSVSEPKAFLCPQCPCTVSSLQEFKYHLQFHSGEHKVGTSQF